jgi:hypothetical protein
MSAFRGLVFSALVLFASSGGTGIGKLVRYGNSGPGGFAAGGSGIGKVAMFGHAGGNGFVANGGAGIGN